MDEATTPGTAQPAIHAGRKTGSPVARRMTIAGVWILGVLGSLLAFHTVRQEARGRLETQFRQRARDRVQLGLSSARQRSSRMPSRSSGTVNS